MFAVAVIKITLLIVVGSIKASEDVIGLHQDDPLLIKTIQEKYLTYHKEGSTYNLSTNPKLNGQFGQADTIEKLFRGKKNGFFVEAGAFDGENFSNTLLFELKHNWTGLLVEPNPDLYQGQAHHMLSQFLNLRNFLCFVCLEGRSFLLRSKMQKPLCSPLNNET